MPADIVKTAQDLYKRDRDGWSEIYRKAKEDLRFLSDEEYSQWDERDARDRRELGRPVLTIDQLGQFIHQVANDIRLNTPTINVIPSDGAADEEIAEIYKGKIKDIEYRSGADDAYDMAALNAIKCSIGFIRIDHDYIDDETELQELFIRRVVNPLSVMIDSESIAVDGSDAMHGHVIDRMSLRAFKNKYPGKSAVSFEDENSREITKDDHEISVCEFFQIVESERRVGYRNSGTPEDFEEGADYTAERSIKKRTVKRFVLSGADILEETTFPGKYIPLVPVYGEEAWENGKRRLFSLIRKSKDAQRMYNYWKSLETELLMKQPQAPIMVAAGSIQNYAEDWQNPSKSMALQYDHIVDGAPVPPPQRLEPPVIPAGIINAAREAVDDIKATMGIYNAALGQRSNETSGVAINQRKIEGDVATYHFGDNLVKSITQVGRILVCAIPEIYDTPRMIRTINEESGSKTVGINGMIADGQERSFDLSQGKYEVRVVTGAPFTTRRQETIAALTEVFKAQPELMMIMGDLYFKNSDFSGAQAMAERMQKAMDPKFLEKEGQDQEKLQLAKALQEAQTAIAAMQQQLEDKRAAEQQKAQIEVIKIQSESEQSKIEAAVKMQELRVKEQEIAIKAQENQIRLTELRARMMQPDEIDQSGSMMQ